ncbi:MAG TPA: hypothetical protein VFQ75_16075 [Candidatus Limnocylindrales bacterium]|nr:hypothetical protein [Candidatus Limnocylindrales bacterium]
MDSLLLMILAVIATAIFANLAVFLGEDSREGFGLPDTILRS